MGGVVGEVGRGEVVGAVDDDVVRLEDAHRRLRVEVLVDRHDLDVRVEVAKGVRRRLDLQATDVVSTVQELALEGGGVYAVEVHDPELPHPGRGQVHAGGRCEAAGAQARDAR